MNTTTLVIIGVVVVAVILILALVLGRNRGGLGKPKLRDLTPEARDRYGAQWDRVEARFVDDPEGAVREADSILMGLLREREHPMQEDRLPNRMRKARRLAMGQDGRGGTEGMRQAMLEYRGVMEEYGRPADAAERERDDRREIAS
ncbi:MAG TPA: hypothetical protein VFB69_03115 [Candidatus Dormibacteraeota bacterium]|nr:hypothetical protein [Candidatus Dormibacteraeota bacterium]